jgi:acetoin utilization protein AcuB
MELKKWMKHPVHHVKPRDTIQHARDIMEKNRVNQLPVEVDGKLVGIITDRDLRDAFPSVFDSVGLGGKKPKAAGADPGTVWVEDVMTSSVTTIDADASIAEAARLMRKERIGALPVLADQRLVGILTRSDLLEALVELDDG